MSVQPLNLQSGVSLNELLADKVVQCAQRQLAKLCELRRLTLVKGEAFEHARARFAGWAKRPSRARAFLLLEKNPGVYIPQPALAAASGMTNDSALRSMIRDLRAWRVTARDERGEMLDVAPFKRGRDLWSMRRVLRPDGSLVEGGARMILLYQQERIRFADAQDMQRGFVPSMLSDLAVIEGSALVIEHDETVTEGQRADLQREAAALAERLDERVRGPQLPLFAANTDGR